MQCPTCLAYVPSEAKACQHCGHHFSSEQLAEQQAFDRRIKKFQPVAAVILVAISLSLGTCVYRAATTPPSAPQVAQTAELWAKATAIAAVKQRMNNPSSFDLVSEEAIPTSEKDGSKGWAVGIDYRGTNAFGGVVTASALVATDETGKVPLQVTDLKPGRRSR